MRWIHCAQIFMISIFAVSCGGNSFSGKANSKSPAVAPVAIPASDADATANPIAESVDSSDALRPCLEALGGEQSEVFDISQGDISEVPEGAIIEIRASGKATVDLSAIQVSKLKGLCIEATGQADMQIDLSASLGGIYYYARGGANILINFSDKNTVDLLATDISGSSAMELVGTAIDCNALNIEQKGSSKITCVN